MPHSSGGGSHGGGFHSSGSHGAHSSGGGSHSGGFRSGGGYRPSRPGGGFGRPRPPRPRTPFMGGGRPASRHHGVPVYAYAHAMARPMQRRPWMWIFYAPIVAFVLYAFLHGLMGQTPLSRDYDTSILLEDRVGCLTETAELRDTMERFSAKTGITPAVIAVTVLIARSST